MTIPAPARQTATILPALAAAALHVGLVWVLVLSVRRDGPDGLEPPPTVHLLSPLPPGGGGRGGPVPSSPAVEPTVAPLTAAPEEPEPVAGDAVAAGVAAADAGEGGGAGGGRGSGTGQGGGPGTGPGVPDSVPPNCAAPPRPRQEVLPPLDYPRTLRGRSVDVTFWIGMDGRVERVAVEPSLDDARFQRSFLEAMRRYRFHPARGPDGSPAPGTLTLTITF